MAKDDKQRWFDCRQCGWLKYPQERPGHLEWNGEFTYSLWIKESDYLDAISPIETARRELAERFANQDKDRAALIEELAGME